MKGIMNASIAIVVLHCHLSLAAPQPESANIFLAGINGKSQKVVYEISPARAEALPRLSWQPESDTPPPVSLKQACMLAKAALKARQPDVDEFLIQHVAIKRMPWNGPRDQWFYEVMCSKIARGSGRESSDAFGIILMDGTSVEPVITPTSR